MQVKSLPRKYDAKSVQAKLNQLYVRRSLLVNLIRNFERYHEWILRTETPESARHFRCRRAAA